MAKQKSQTAELDAPVLNTPVPPEATFTLELSKLIAGPAPVIPDAMCEFHYKWDFAKNMGLAQLVSINNCAVNIELTAMGIKGQLGFISVIPPTWYVINGVRVNISQVVLVIELANGEKSAEIAFNNDKSVIQGTPNIPTNLGAVHNVVPPSATFTCVLSQLLQGPAPVLPDAECEFTYKWNFLTNMGTAELISIDGTAVNIPLYPLGIAGMLDFMSDMPPTTFTIQGKKVVIYRVILDISLLTGERSAAIMFNPDGSVIQATPNFAGSHLSSLSITVPPEATFNLVLDKLYKGHAPVIPNAVCTFHYKWDFKTNMGLGQLLAINGSPVNITLHPTGLAGMLAFMSDIPPTRFVINGQAVMINRVILNVMLNNGERKAGIMFNADGSVIQVTANFGVAQMASLENGNKAN